MKYLLGLFLFLIPGTLLAQYPLIHWFDEPHNLYRSSFYIDTVSCDSNQWQIGRPQKNIFDVAYSAPNAIVTDTLNPYRANDTSVFYLTSVGDYHGMLSMEFLYRLDIDTLTTVKVELSGDVGQNWINPMTEDDVYLFYWTHGKPRLDTPSVGWETFSLNMDLWSESFPGGSGVTFPHYRTSDTMIFRFTFMSGHDTAKHNGWMIDNFLVGNTVRMNVPTNHSTGMLFFPNPSKGTIFLQDISNSETDVHIEIHDIHGREVYSTNAKDGSAIYLPLPNGVYSLKYTRRDQTFVSKLIISH